jgi:hypothetical protein
MIEESGTYNKMTGFVCRVYETPENRIYSILLIEYSIACSSRYIHITSGGSEGSAARFIVLQSLTSNRFHNDLESIYTIIRGYLSPILILVDNL